MLLPGAGRLLPGAGKLLPGAGKLLPGAGRLLPGPPRVLPGVRGFLMGDGCGKEAGEDIAYNRQLFPAWTLCRRTLISYTD